MLYITTVLGYCQLQIKIIDFSAALQKAVCDPMSAYIMKSSILFTDWSRKKQKTRWMHVCILSWATKELGFAAAQSESNNKKSAVSFTRLSVNKLKMWKYVFFTGRRQTTFLHTCTCNKWKKNLFQTQNVWQESGNIDVNRSYNKVHFASNNCTLLSAK